MIPNPQQAGDVEPRHVGEIFDDPRPGYMFKKAIQAVKDAVPIEQVAAEYGEFKLQGAGRLLGHCVAPDHEDRTPSMTIYTERRKFKCFGCGLHGDVVDLERIAGRHIEAWTAMIALAERYGVELPERPDKWFRKQNRQERTRAAIREQREMVKRRRLFKIIMVPLLQGVGADEDDVRIAWEDFQRAPMPESMRHE